MRNAVIFDFDGPIVNSFARQFEWSKFICDKYGKSFDYKSLDEFREVYREPYPEMYEFLGFDWEKEGKVINEEWRQFFDYSIISLVEGIEDVFRILRGNNFKLGIASSNGRDNINKILSREGLFGYFEDIVAWEDIPEQNGTKLLKPHPNCLLQVLTNLECLPEETIYVGDQPTDVEASRSAMIEPYCVTYGFASRKGLLGYVDEYHLLETFKDLLGKLGL